MCVGGEQDWEVGGMKLLTCPFCGGEAEEYWNKIPDWADLPNWLVVKQKYGCRSCDIWMPSVKEWNYRRVPRWMEAGRVIMKEARP